MKHQDYFTSLFEPKSVAFIGASNNPFKWGFNILHHILKGGYAGAIYPVNPQGGDWFGQAMYRSLEEVPSPVDCAVIVVPKEQVPETLGRCAALKIPAAVIITAGFSETGPDGARLEEEALSEARRGGIRLVGPNTMGVFSAYPSPLQAVMMSSSLKPGPVAVISQSGNLGTSISYRFIRREIGISRLISSGNEADLRVEDYLEYLERDERTKIICLYIEGLRDGRRFMEIARRVTLSKPILLLKGGTGSIGAGAAMSHTGAIAGSFGTFRAMCRQCNIILVDHIGEMVDVAGFLLSQPVFTGNRIGIVTQGGGWGVISADLCEAHDLKVPPLNEKVVSLMDAFLPPFWSRGNPVDLVAPGKVSMITDAIDIILKNTEMDAILLLGLGYMTLRARHWLESPVIPRAAIEPHALRMIEGEAGLLGLIEEQIKKYDKPIIPVIDQVAFDDTTEHNVVRRLDREGVMAYSSPEQAIQALAKVHDYYRRRDKRRGETRSPR